MKCSYRESNDEEVRYVLVALEIQKVSIDVVYKIIPMHCTILQWAKMPDYTTVKDVLQIVSVLSKEAPPVILKTQSRNLFGEDFNIPVTKLVTAEDLLTLHNHTKDYIENLGSELCNPKWTGGGFNSYVTDIGNWTFISNSPFVATKIFLTTKDTRAGPCTM